MKRNKSNVRNSNKKKPKIAILDQNSDPSEEE